MAEANRVSAMTVANRIDHYKDLTFNVFFLPYHEYFSLQFAWPAMSQPSYSPSKCTT